MPLRQRDRELLRGALHEYYDQVERAHGLQAWERDGAIGFRHEYDRVHYERNGPEKKDKFSYKKVRYAREGWVMRGDGSVHATPPVAQSPEVKVLVNPCDGARLAFIGGMTEAKKIRRLEISWCGDGQTSACGMEHPVTVDVLDDLACASLHPSTEPFGTASFQKGLVVCVGEALPGREVARSGSVRSQQVWARPPQGEKKEPKADDDDEGDEDPPLPPGGYIHSMKQAKDVFEEMQKLSREEDINFGERLVDVKRVCLVVIDYRDPHNVKFSKIFPNRQGPNWVGKFICYPCFIPGWYSQCLGVSFAGDRDWVVVCPTYRDLMHFPLGLLSCMNQPTDAGLLCWDFSSAAASCERTRNLLDDGFPEKAAGAENDRFMLLPRWNPHFDENKAKEDQIAFGMIGKVVPKGTFTGHIETTWVCCFDGNGKPLEQPDRIDDARVDGYPDGESSFGFIDSNRYLKHRDVIPAAERLVELRYAGGKWERRELDHAGLLKTIKGGFFCNPAGSRFQEHPEILYAEADGSWSAQIYKHPVLGQHGCGDFLFRTSCPASELLAGVRLFDVECERPSVMQKTYQELTGCSAGDPLASPDIQTQCYFTWPKSSEKVAGILLNMHGGPHVAVSTGLHHLISLWAEKLRLLVVSPNYRGSTTLGPHSSKALQGRCGDLDCADCEAWCEFARKNFFGDGVCPPILLHGGSHGGFLTTSLSGRNRLRSIAGAMTRNPVTDIAAMPQQTDIPEWCAAEGLGNGLELKSRCFRNFTDAEFARLRGKSPVNLLSEDFPCDMLMQLGTSDKRVPPRPQGWAYVNAFRRAVRGKREITLEEYEGEGHALSNKVETEPEVTVSMMAFSRRCLQNFWKSEGKERNCGSEGQEDKL